MHRNDTHILVCSGRNHDVMLVFDYRTSSSSLRKPPSDFLITFLRFARYMLQSVKQIITRQCTSNLLKMLSRCCANEKTDGFMAVRIHTPLTLSGL